MQVKVILLVTEVNSKKIANPTLNIKCKAKNCSYIPSPLYSPLQSINKMYSKRHRRHIRHIVHPIQPQQSIPLSLDRITSALFSSLPPTTPDRAIPPIFPLVLSYLCSELPNGSILHKRLHIVYDIGGQFFSLYPEKYRVTIYR